MQRIEPTYFTFSIAVLYDNYGGRIIDNLQIDNLQIDNRQIDNQNLQIDNRQIDNLQITFISEFPIDNLSFCFNFLRFKQIFFYLN